MNNIKRYLLATLCLVFTAGQSKALTLQEVCSAAPEIANHRPSKKVSPVGGTEVKVNGITYEIRLFFLDDMPKNTHGKTFKEVLSSFNILEKELKRIDQGYGPLYAASSTEEMKKEGVHFVLSMRKSKLVG